MKSTHKITQERPLESALRSRRGRRCPSLGRGFSLVEVVLALGIISFCLVPLFGLLPVGLRSVKNSNEQTGAANAVASLATAIRYATNVAGSYTITNYVSPISWSRGGGVVVVDSNDIGSLGLDGLPDSSTGRLRARIVITPPPDANSVGIAEISVAWPAAAEYATSNWTKSEGSISTAIRFLPRQESTGP